MPDELDLGLAMIRITAGLLMAAHGAQKLLGWWGGSSMSKWSADLEGQGIRAAALWAWVSVGGQMAGLVLAIGLLTPLAAAASLVAPMVVVVVQKWPKGFFNVRGGIEFMVLILITGIALILTGPGSVSVDALIGIDLDLPVRLAIAVAAVAGALLAVLPGRSARRSG
jgi:putative oxidoreductase